MSNWIHPIIFDNPDAESKFYQSEACNTTDDLPVVDQGVDLMAANASPKLFGDLIPSTGADIEVLPMQAEILTPPEVGFPTAPLSPHVPPYPRTEVQVAGDLYVYRQDQVGSPRPVVAAESKPSSAPKPLELAEKLLKMDSFAMYEKQLYVFDRKRGIYLALDRDDAKRIIVNRLSDDLRIRGTAYQIKEVYEYLRLHPHIRVVDKAPRHLLAFTNGMVASSQIQHRKNGDVKRYISYSCNRYLRSGRCVCSRHRVSELTLAQIISEEIRAQAQAVTLDKDAFVDKLKCQIADLDERRLSGVKQEISRLRRRVHELESLTAKLYEDKYGGAISGDTFVLLMQKNEQERLAKAERLETLLAEVNAAEKKVAAIHDWAALIQKYLNLQKLDRAVLDELIDHIEIGERAVVDGQRHQDIKVFYRYVGLVE